MVWAELQKQIDNTGLKVSLTIISGSLNEVETLSEERSRMRHSSRQIMDHSRNRAIEKPETAEAEMEPAQRKAMDIISVMSCIPK